MTDAPQRRLRNLMLGCIAATFALLVAGSLMVGYGGAECNANCPTQVATVLIVGIGVLALSGFAAFAAVMTIVTYARQQRDLAAAAAEA